MTRTSVALAQALELGEHLAAEVGPIEADDEELDGSERHGSRPRSAASTLRFAIWNSSGERTPSSWSAFKPLSCSMTSGPAPPEAGGATTACRWASSCFCRASSKPAWKPTPPSIIGARLSGLSSISPCYCVSAATRQSACTATWIMVRVVRLVLNLIWLIFGGLVLAFGYAVVALVMFILIVTIPFGIASARIALFCLWPFGRTLVKRPGAGAGSLIGNIVWFILAGWWLAIGHI